MFAGKSRRQEQEEPLESGSGEQKTGRRLSVKAAARVVRATDHLSCAGYLEAVYQTIKKSSSRYSYLMFAEDLGFAPTNAIRLIIVGRRKISRKNAQRVARALGLTKEERRYFIGIADYHRRRLGRARSSALKKTLEQKSSALSGSSQAGLLRYFSSWISPVVREAARIPGFSPTSDWIDKHMLMHITEQELVRSVHLLEELGYIAWNPETNTVQPVREEPQALLSDLTAEYLGFLKYHEECLDRAKEALHAVPEDMRGFNVVTVNVRRSVLRELNARIEDLCQWFLSQEHLPHRAEEDDSLTCQLSAQFFCVTRGR